MVGVMVILSNRWIAKLTRVVIFDLHLFTIFLDLPLFTTVTDWSCRCACMDKTECNACHCRTSDRIGIVQSSSFHSSWYATLDRGKIQWAGLPLGGMVPKRLLWRFESPSELVVLHFLADNSPTDRFDANLSRSFFSEMPFLQSLGGKLATREMDDWENVVSELPARKRRHTI